MSSTCSTGTSPRVTAAIESHVMLVRRGPNRSTIGPPRMRAETRAPSSTKVTTPVCTALPVLCRTNHGTAMTDMRVPLTEISSAASRP